MDKTFYNGTPSDCEGKNGCRVTGAPKAQRVNADKKYKEALNSWKETVANQVERKIKLNIIDAIPEGAECNLYITFYLCREGRKALPDVDNLVKAFLDPLQKTYGDKEKPKIGAGLINDDGCIRGIRAEREVVNNKAEEGVRIKYLLTKKFKIVKLEPLDVKTLQNEYRSYWKNEMNLIIAYEIDSDRKKFGKFIDNCPGNAFSGDKSDTYVDVIPGYHWGYGWDWKSNNGDNPVIEGCMVFHKTHQREDDKDKDKDEKFWWINKW